MKSFVCAAAALALAGTASAGFFQIGAVDASDGQVAGGQTGTGLDFNGGTVYHHAFQSPDTNPTGEPGQALIGAFPSSQYDSYLTIDHAPVSPGYDGTNVPGTGLAPGSDPTLDGDSFRGAWFVSGPFVRSVEAIDKPGVEHELFIGRITLEGGFLSGAISVSLSELAPGTDPNDQDNYFDPVTIVGDIVTEAQVAAGEGLITHDVDGNELVKFSATGGTRGYAWVIKPSQQDVAWGVDGASDVRPVTVYDIWLQNVVVPTPGAMGLLGVAGLAAIRRRR